MKNEKGTIICNFPESLIYILYYNILLVFLMMVIPLILIVVLNLATVATLSRQRIRSHVVSGSRGHGSGFTKLTILTGASLVFSYTPVCVVKVYELFEREQSDLLWRIIPPCHVLLYFNSFMNPIICVIVCKSTRNDLKHFLGVLTRKFRRSFICTCMCKGPQQEVQTIHMNTASRGLEIVELNTADAGITAISLSRY